MSSIKVQMDDKSVAGATYINDGRDTLVSLPAGLPSASQVILDLGPDPQLAVRDHRKAISRLLLDFQMPFSMKDRIWEIVEAEQPATVEVGRFLSLSLDEILLGPISELLLADSRSLCLVSGLMRDSAESRTVNWYG